jgi:hypothetical protein
MDVVFNIAQKEFTEDNWLLRANNAGYKWVFHNITLHYTYIIHNMNIDV